MLLSLKKIEKSCKLCNKLFISYKSNLLQYCSHKCSANSRIGIKRPLISLRMIGHIVSKETRKKIGAKNRISNLGKKQTLKQIEKRVSQFRGKNSHFWKGGITSTNKLERIKFSRYFRKQVFERDNYTCQMCGVRGVVLQVDHIQEWSEYVELRFSMDNCRTLCSKCHYFVTFGKEMPREIKTWGHNLKFAERMVV